MLASLAACRVFATHLVSYWYAAAHGHSFYYDGKLTVQGNHTHSYRHHRFARTWTEGGLVLKFLI